MLTLDFLVSLRNLVVSPARTGACVELRGIKLIIFCHSIFLSDWRSDKKLKDKKLFHSLRFKRSRFLQRVRPASNGIAKSQPFAVSPVRSCCGFPQIAQAAFPLQVCAEIVPSIDSTVDEGPILRKWFRQISYCQLIAIRSQPAGSFHLQFESQLSRFD